MNYVKKYALQTVKMQDVTDTVVFAEMDVQTILMEQNVMYVSKVNMEQIVSLTVQSIVQVKCVTEIQALALTV